MRTQYNAEAPAFWRVLPRIAGYPFRGVAAITLGAMVVLEFLSGMPVLGLAIALFAKVLAFNYVLEIVRDSADGHRDPPEIGRASCRERVCQYVLISGVAVSIKKKRDDRQRIMRFIMRSEQ